MLTTAMFLLTLATEWSIESWVGYRSATVDLGLLFVLWVTHSSPVWLCGMFACLLTLVRGIGSAVALPPTAAATFAAVILLLFIRNRVNLHEIAFRAFWILPPVALAIWVDSRFHERAPLGWSGYGVDLGLAFLSAILLFPILDVAGTDRHRRSP